MKLSSMPLAIVLSAVGIFFATTGQADEKQQILDVIKWATPVMGAGCNFSLLKNKDNPADAHYFEVKYRDKGQDQDSPDNVFPLYQLLCNTGAYNSSYIFLTKDGNGYKLLAFAMPKLDYDYTDENFTKLKAPPKVIGYTATTELVDPDFDAETNSISMHAKWRGLGDASSSGVWKFVDGEFVLSEYDVDPTYDLNAPDAKQDDRAQHESYQVFPLPAVTNQ